MQGNLGMARNNTIVQMLSELSQEFHRRALIAFENQLDEEWPMLLCHDCRKRFRLRREEIPMKIHCPFCGNLWSGEED